MELLKRVIQNAQKYQKRIVLAEGAEPRTLRATEIILKQNLAKIILLGNPDEIKKGAQECGVSIEGATICDPRTDPRRDLYADIMVEIRKAKVLPSQRPWNY
jgi:phosphate acetyltransferase